MNNKGFVLMETIVVIVVISVALLTIFTSYNKILSKLKSENKYDNSEYIYMTNYIKTYMQEKCSSVVPQNINNSVTDHYNESPCKVKDATGIDNFKVKKIYVLSNINDGGDEKFKKFDGYMIDYIRKLDVNNNDSVIIVEFGKNALDDKGKPKKDSNTNQLTETYIASLEW